MVVCLHRLLCSFKIPTLLRQFHHDCCKYHSFADCMLHKRIRIIIRRPDISVGGFTFYRDLLLLPFRPLPSEFAERNLTKTGHILGSKCYLKMYVRNLPPLQIGRRKITTTSQRNGNFSGIYLFSERNITHIIGQVRWQL